jgi:hypothetical protein
MATFFLGLASLCGGRLADAVQLFQQVVTTLAGARAAERFGEPGPPAQFARAFLGLSLAELGRFNEAVAVGEESLRMAQAIDEPFTLMHGYIGAGIPYLFERRRRPRDPAARTGPRALPGDGEPSLVGCDRR